MSALRVQYVWTAPSGLELQTGVRLWTEREASVSGDDEGGRVPAFLSSSDPA